MDEGRWKVDQWEMNTVYDALKGKIDTTVLITNNWKLVRYKIGKNYF